MKNAIILHGTSGNPQSFWQPSIKKFLEKNGYNVWVPQLPNSDNPNLDTQLPFVMGGAEFNSETILIGHSAGGPLVLSVLENIKTTIHKAVLVSGYARPVGEKKETQEILQKEYNWSKIRSAVKDLIIINSTNDPWGCNHEEGLFIFRKTGGTLLLLDGEGHMGSEKFNQPYKEFPLLEKLLEVKYTRTVI